MDRDEFMELVYETFAEEPDNVLANGIIEAADAYAEHEKAQLSCEGTTSDTISKTETVEHLRRVLESTVPNTDYGEGFIDGVEFGISTVSTMPTVQPQSTTGQLNDGAQSTARSTDLIDRQAAIDAVDAIGHIATMPDGDKCIRRSAVKYTLSMLPPAQPEHKVRFADKDHVWIDGKQYISLPRFQEAVKEAQPKEGHWIGKYPTTHICSECGWLIPDSKVKVFAYCPHCGARMRGGQNG